jgi:hypothetical protein
MGLLTLLTLSEGTYEELRGDALRLPFVCTDARCGYSWFPGARAGNLASGLPSSVWANCRLGRMVMNPASYSSDPISGIPQGASHTAHTIGGDL